MNLKKLGTSLVVVFVLGSVLAGSASATAVTQDVKWKEGLSLNTEVTNGTAMKAENSSGGFFDAFIGGTTLTLTWSGISCVECTITNASGSATGRGMIKFENVSVATPLPCKVNGGSVTTKQLEVEADWMEGTTNLIRLRPTFGSTLATFKLEKGFGTCAIAGSYNVTGVLFGKGVNATNVAAEMHEVEFSPSINSSAGGELRLGGESAELFAGVTFGFLSTRFFGTN
jgi:hypothetical protein